MSDSLLIHIFAQTQTNISLLASQGHISATDASDMISRLATAQSRAGTSASNTPSIESSIQALSIAPAPVSAPMAPPFRRNVPPPPARTQRAKALWGYNENGQEPNDLSFSVGEIVEIVDETNTDWWTGKCRGKQGLFPSNHVEKIDAGSTPVSPAPPVMPTQPYSPPGYSPQGYMPSVEKPVYRPFGAAHHGVDMPPPSTVGGTNSVGLQEAPGQEQKKSKFGKLGNTMATSAAGGVGFGAGAAIGSGIVNAIF